MGKKEKPSEKNGNPAKGKKGCAWRARPCGECMFFRVLGGRFGVCDKGEHPSSHVDCPLFRRALKR